VQCYVLSVMDFPSWLMLFGRHMAKIPHRGSVTVLRFTDTGTRTCMRSLFLARVSAA